MKGKRKVDFLNLWLNHKIEMLREIEHLCSAIMNILEIAEDPSNGIKWDGIIEGEPANRDYVSKIHPSLKGIDWGKYFDKLRKGEKILEYADFRHWYGMNREGGTSVTLFFHTGDPKDVDINNPRWIQTYYGENLGSFQAIRDDCKILSRLLESVDAAYDEQDFKAIDNTVNGIIQSIFLLIGIHDQEHQITAKLREYEAQAQKRKKAYEEGPGAASAIAGGWSIKAAEQILNTCGGIAGYDALPYGDKKTIRTKIENAIKDPDGRNVYNILKKIRNKAKQN